MALTLTATPTPTGVAPARQRHRRHLRLCPFWGTKHNNNDGIRIAFYFLAFILAVDLGFLYDDNDDRQKPTDHDATQPTRHFGQGPVGLRSLTMPIFVAAGAAAAYSYYKKRSSGLEEGVHRFLEWALPRYRTEDG